MSEISYESWIKDVEWVEDYKPKYTETPPKGGITARLASEMWKVGITTAKSRLAKMTEDGKVTRILVKELGSATIIPYYIRKESK